MSGISTILTPINWTTLLSSDGKYTTIWKTPVNQQEQLISASAVYNYDQFKP